MNETIKTIMERRTYRKFKKNQISDEELKIIIDAGLYAPSAGGRQSPIFLVSQDEETNLKLGKINKLLFGGANSDGIHFVSKNQKSISDDDSIVSGFYDAPTVITLFAPKKWLYGTEDCVMAVENMILAASSLGIGSCYVSRAQETFSSELGKSLMIKLGLDDTFEAKMHLCLGYPDGDKSDPKPRKEGRVKYIK